MIDVDELENMIHLYLRHPGRPGVAVGRVSAQDLGECVAYWLASQGIEVGWADGSRLRFPALTPYAYPFKDHEQITVRGRIVHGHAEIGDMVHYRDAERTDEPIHEVVAIPDPEPTGPAPVFAHRLSTRRYTIRDPRTRETTSDELCSPGWRIAHHEQLSLSTDFTAVGRQALHDGIPADPDRDPAIRKALALFAPRQGADYGRYIREKWSEGWHQADLAAPFPRRPSS